MKTRDSCHDPNHRLEAGCRLADISFYVTTYRCKQDPQIVGSIANLAHAVTIAGHDGPELLRRLRASGLELPALIDGRGYDPDKKRLYPEDWVRRQRLVRGLIHPLLPGIYLAWDTDREANSAFATSVRQQGRIASDLGAAVLIALDARWLAKKRELVVEVLRSADVPVALVLAHQRDPLATRGAVRGLRHVTHRVPHLSLLRSDHGAVGALAFGAEHASIGLTTSTRHYATRKMGAWKHPGGTARLFIRPLLDWFLVTAVAGWTAAGKDVICSLACCGEQRLERFLDPDLDETWHNMNALADFANYICNAPPADREVEFVDQCRAATSRYGLAGWDGPKNPKAQLTGWALL